MSVPIINYTGEKKRRIDLIIGISYDDDIDKAKKVLNEIAKADNRIIHKD
jgi:small conductance mechanosensitive channel